MSRMNMINLTVTSIPWGGVIILEYFKKRGIRKWWKKVLQRETVSKNHEKIQMLFWEKYLICVSHGKCIRVSRNALTSVSGQS